ncbi:hypothetical protein WJX84_008876, partial [Apatococcus fuscideae]
MVPRKTLQLPTSSE